MARTMMRRLLFVHAHPDDEATSTGATMARYAREGATVSIVTCTRGELGEVVAPDLAYLVDEGPDALARHREGELAAALVTLGVERQHWLGGAGRWRDSGMVGTPGNTAPGAFAAADLAEPTQDLVALLRTERPQVVVTYDSNGGYGHPDHVRVHDVTMAALAPAADPAYGPELGEPWQVSKVYWTAIPRSVIEQGVAVGAIPSIDEVPGSTPDEEITAAIDGRDLHDVKVAALRAHRSQVDLTNGLFGMLVGVPEFSVEHYVLARGVRGSGSGPHGWEDDLFAGLTP